MKYKKEERLKVGRKTHESGLSNLNAGIMFGISEESARRYRIFYEKSQGIEHDTSRKHKGSGEFSVKDLCEHMDISRSSFYYWKNRLNNPSNRTKAFISNILLFKEYHEKYPSHGYR